jgi:hypothetical protein
LREGDGREKAFVERLWVGENLHAVYEAGKATNEVSGDLDVA